MFSDDLRLQNALNSARMCLSGAINLPQAKAAILECNTAASEVFGNPVAQAAVRAIEQYATEKCGRMEAALRAVAVENEPNRAKIDWKC